MYQRWLDEEDVSKIKEADDPFWDSPEDVLVGSTSIYLKFLCFPMDFDYQAAIKDYKGTDEGILDVYITPCEANGKDRQDLDLLDSDFTEPEEAVEALRGKPFNFRVCCMLT